MGEAVDSFLQLGLPTVSIDFNTPNILYRSPGLGQCTASAYSERGL